MTSKPASRSARAMILAPRSWPSRPGLAIRMRRRRSDTRASQPGGVAVDAEHLAEDVGDLAHRDLGLHRLDDRRHQVLSVPRRRPHRRDALVHETALAPLLALAHACHLRALDLVADTQDL